MDDGRWTMDDVRNLRRVALATNRSLKLRSGCCPVSDKRAARRSSAFLRKPMRALASGRLNVGVSEPPTRNKERWHHASFQCHDFTRKFIFRLRKLFFAPWITHGSCMFYAVVYLTHFHPDQPLAKFLHLTASTFHRVIWHHSGGSQFSACRYLLSGLGVGKSRETETNLDEGGSCDA